MPLVQEYLDNFRVWWNAHKLRKQAGKKAPTGVNPEMIRLIPEFYDPNVRDYSVPVEREWVELERSYLGGMEAWEKLFEFYPLTFNDTALNVWRSFG